ncbi:MAG: SOS response-associated peptidase [Thermoanaerobaculales bacterium]
MGLDRLLAYHGGVCGRYTLTVDASVLATVFGLDPSQGYRARYNIAPTQVVPIVRRSSDLPRIWTDARWGLVPPWAKDVKMGARLINARGETAAFKPSFKSAVKHRRCLVPADGFYEWVKTGSGKQPYYIHFEDRRPFAFAGLWERWGEDRGSPLETFTIITTRANALIAPLHDRMPVILPPGQFKDWLAPRPFDPARLEALIVPHNADGMVARPVSNRVNSPANDDPACIRPMH